VGGLPILAALPLPLVAGWVRGSQLPSQAAEPGPESSGYSNSGVGSPADRACSTAYGNSYSRRPTRRPSPAGLKPCDEGTSSLSSLRDGEAAGALPPSPGHTSTTLPRHRKALPGLSAPGADLISFREGSPPLLRFVGAKNPDLVPQ